MSWSNPAAPAELACPRCGAPMRALERAGVHVDQCRGCAGLFLDRGELQRIIDLEVRRFDDDDDDDDDDRWERRRDDRRRPDDRGWREAPGPAAPGWEAGRPSAPPAWPQQQGWGGPPPAGYAPEKKKSKTKSFLGELLEGFGD